MWLVNVCACANYFSRRYKPGVSNSYPQWVTITMHFLPSIIVFLFAYYAQAQGGCAMITEEDLSGGLLVKTYNSNLNPENPIILVEEFSVVCLAAASKRDTYRYISIVVRQICLLSLCPEDQRDRSSLVQYDFECDSTDKWSTKVFGDTNIRDDNPAADLETELRTNCSACWRLLPGIDSVTHCRRKLFFSRSLAWATISNLSQWYNGSSVCVLQWFLPTLTPEAGMLNIH